MRNSRLLSHRCYRAILIASCLGAATQCAHAQAAQDSAARAESVKNDGDVGLAEIIVTAQRREQNIQNVPMAISAMSGSQLASRGVVNTADLAKVSPGVLVAQIGASSTATAVNIRGVAQLDYSDHQESPNAIYLDGAYVSFQGATGIGMYDVERIEVLRGPQGTLFGRNATGGLVQIISRKPTFDEQGYIEATYGSHNESRLEGALGGALADTVAARGSFQINRQDGFIKNSNGRDAAADQTLNGRFQLRWQPTSAVDNNLLVFLSDTDTSGGSYFIAPSAPDPNNHGLGVLTNGPLFIANCAALGYPPVTSSAANCLGYVKPSSDPYRIESGQIGTFSRDIVGVTDTLSWELGGNTALTSITNYTHLSKEYNEDSDGTPLNIITYHSNQDSWQFSQELRLSGESERFRWTAGGYYLRIDGDYGVGLNLADSFGPTLGADYDQRVETYSVFGQAEFDLTGSLTLISGLRETRDTKRLHLVARCSLDADSCTAGGLAPQGYAFDGSYSDSDWSGKVQLMWKPVDHLNLYAGVNRGNKGSLIVAPIPVGAGAVFADVLVRPEVLTDYEAGVKSSLFGGNLVLAASAFYYDYDDYQAYSFVGISQRIFNAKAKYYGGEASVVARLGQGFSLNLSGAALHTRVLDVGLPDGTVVDQKAPYAPALSLNADLRKEFDLGNQNGAVFVQASGVYFSSRYFSTINEPAVRAPSATTLDLTLGYTSADRKWDATLFIANVTDEVYKTYAVGVSSIAGFTQINYNRPRWVSFKLGYRF